MFHSLSSKMFQEALGMCGLAAVDAPRFQGRRLHHPEQKLAAFFTHLGLPPIPGQQIQHTLENRADDTQLMPSSITSKCLTFRAADAHSVD